MAIKRSELIDSDNAGYYHLISRCVRRAFLCGMDEESGNNYEYRRQWIERRILQLAHIFSIEVYAYSVMQNHYHLVVYSDPKAPQTWSDYEVAERWLKLFPGKLNDPDNYFQKQARIQAIANDPELLATYRLRLGSLSWLMKCINEPLAKKSNKEDGAKGHFWESRFTSQALFDETAVLTCMAYVDLNPIRAGVCEKLEDSEFASIQNRCKFLREHDLQKTLGAVAGKEKGPLLTIHLKDYLQLVEWTGQSITYPDKAKIPSHLKPTLSRLYINHKEWTSQVTNFGSNYYRAVGCLSKLQEFTNKIKQNWLKGKRSIDRLYTSTV